MVLVVTAVTALTLIGQLCLPASAGAVDPATLKPVISGLLDRKGMPPAGSVSKLDGFVVKVNWSDVQRTAFGPIVTGNPIDTALAAVRSLPAAAHFQLKLRILAGIYSPTSVKNLAGGPVNVYYNRKTYTMGKFWTPSFGDAYNDLQSKLAAKYDSTPEIGEVVIARCTVMTAEPFLRAVRADTRTMHSMLLSGYTDTADEVCQHEEIDAHQVWAQTRSGLTLDPYDRLRADGSAIQDEAFTEATMQYCRATLGARCVLENDAISSPLLPDPYPAMYAAIRAMGPPVGYQTRNDNRIGDWYKTLTWAAAQGASYVELNTGYSNYDPAQLESARSQLKSNPTG